MHPIVQLHIKKCTQSCNWNSKMHSIVQLRRQSNYNNKNNKMNNTASRAAYRPVFFSLFSFYIFRDLLVISDTSRYYLK